MHLHDFEANMGQGRIVVALMWGLEHVLGLVALLVYAVIPSVPYAVRNLHQLRSWAPFPYPMPPQPCAAEHVPPHPLPETCFHARCFMPHAPHCMFVCCMSFNRSKWL